MPSDVALTLLNRVHRFVIRVSRGRLGWNLLGMPVVELTTIGRRSGEPRSVMLTSPVRLGKKYVVVGSRGGDARHPAWFLNVLAEPRVEVSVKGGPREPMIARVANPADRALLWPRVVQHYRGYGGYQRRTAREIPLVVLERVN